MFSRLIHESLPSPTEEQLQTMLIDKEIGLFSEIISAAFEPRFKLYALGSATGDFHFINSKHHRFSYIPIATEPPVLKIIPLTNSPTFLSVSSFSLYTNHCLNVPRQERPIQNNNIFFKPKSILSEVRPEKFSSSVIHWIVTDDGNILQRPKSLKYDILDFAASPVHPEFVLLLTRTGSIYGFSVEEMDFTDLYIDAFEGKNVHSIICPSEVNFFICHDKIEKLNIFDKTISDGYQINASQIDLLDDKSDKIATIDFNSKKPSLFNGNRPGKPIDCPEGSVGKCVSMINDKEWASVVHSNSTDSIYLKKNMKIGLEGEILIPSIVVEYKNQLARDEPVNVTFFTNTGRFIDLNGNSMDHFMLKPIEPKFAFIDKNDNIYVFSANKLCFVFESFNFAGCFIFDWPKPLTVLNGYSLCLNGDNELLIVDIKKNQKVNLNSPLTHKPIVSYQIFESYIDFLCQTGKVIRFDLSKKEVFEGEEVADANELNVCQNYPSNMNIKHWRPFKNTFSCIKDINGIPMLIVDKYIFPEIITEKGEKIVSFEVIDEKGRISSSQGQFILVVSTFNIGLFGIDEGGIKRIRHSSFSSPNEGIVESTITDWGVLIIRTTSNVEVFILPDFSNKPISHLSLTYEAPPPIENEVKSINPIILPNKGLIVFERNLVTIFLREIIEPNCFDKNKMPDVLIRPVASGFKKIFNRHNSMTVEEADRCFLFNRKKTDKKYNTQYNIDSNADKNEEEIAKSTAKNISNSLSETHEIMQLALLKANERGEQLNELEIKAQKLLASTKQYRKNCRQFRH